MTTLLIDWPTGPSPLPDAATVNSQWRAAGPGTGGISVGADVDVIVFFDCQQRLQGRGAHVADGLRIRKFVEDGGIFIAFTAEPEGYRIGNLIAEEVGIPTDANHANEPKNVIPQPGPYLEWYSRWAGFLNSCVPLQLPPAMNPEIIAKHGRTGFTVAALAHVGVGLIVWLPVPADPGAAVIEAIDVARSLVTVPSEHWINRALAAAVDTDQRRGSANIAASRG